MIHVANGSDVAQYTYNAANRLTNASMPNGSNITNVYDVDGWRVQQTTGSQTTNYLWDETSRYGDVVLETNGSNITSYVYGGAELISQTRNNVASYYLHDGQGSVRNLTNSSSILTDTYKYSAFGETLNHIGSTINPYQYTGQQLDSQSGLYDLRSRYYDPALGRFLSQDVYPYNISDPAQLNRFTYTANNPVNFMDPLGLQALAEYTMLQEKNEVQAEAEGEVYSTEGDTLLKEACEVNSFSADTNVATQDGEKAISEIKIGDYVLAWNWETGEISFYPVTDTIHHTDKTIVHLTIEDETLTTTLEHPFYVEGRGWVKTKDLQVGDDVRGADGSTGKVKSIKTENATQEMYNLTVDEAHTFYVGNGQWLVHNTGCGIDLSDYSPKPDKGTAFSGIYDPESGEILLRPSGNTTLADGSPPLGRVLPRRGHRTVFEALKLLNPDVTGTGARGFTVFYEEAGTLNVEFISGFNGPSRVLDVSLRQPILDALSNAFENVLIIGR